MYTTNVLLRSLSTKGLLPFEMCFVIKTNAYEHVLKENDKLQLKLQ